MSRASSAPAELSEYDHVSNQVKAAKRLKSVKTAKQDLIEFCRLCFPHPEDPDDSDLSRYKAQKHHRVIAAALQEVEKGAIPRLIITMPPRAGKSEISAKKFIPWLLGKDPYRHVIFATYNDTFAEDTGRSSRITIKMPVFNQIFPECHLRPGSQAADRLETLEGGIAAFVGVGGSIMGRGADFLIIDDPVKDREQADSPTERSKQWSWFTDVAMTRLMDAGARVVIIMTRWHEDDLIGRLTDPQNECFDIEEARKWKILALPAIADDNDPIGRKKGESLWPDKFPVEFLESARRMNPKSFSALYQGKPAPEDGDHFKKEFIFTYKRDELPKNLRNYSASDHAVSLAQERDSTCLIHAGVDEEDTLWIYPDLFWKQADTMEVTEAMITGMATHHPMFWWAENGHISKSIGPFLRKRMMELKVFCAIIEMTPIKDKKARAQSIQARMAMGKVRFPSFAPWWPEAMNQLLKFPGSTHDDFVDALSWLGIGLNYHVRASGPAKQSDILPEPGTLAWIKAQSKHEKEQEKAATQDGF